MFEMMQGDITQCEVDAIVCPAHKYLSKGRGLSALIHELAGPELAAACAEAGDCPAGQAVITDAFNLPCRHIIHTVPPLWTGGDQWGGSTLSVLGDCFRNSLQVARENGLGTVVFPALGTGLHHAPHTMVAHEALEILVPAADEFERLVVCLDSADAHAEWESCYRRFFSGD